MPENIKYLQGNTDTNRTVVHLEAEQQRVSRARLARLPAPVHAVHEKGKFQLLQSLKGFFDKADDSLFDLADKATSNQEQNLYFDSMREIRVQRLSIEKRFSDVVDKAFEALIVPEEARERDVYNENISADALSLVQNDDLEEMVAVEGSVARVHRAHGEAIQHISLRLDSLVPTKVYVKNNPLSPDVISDAFMAQVKRLDIGIRAKLVLFKLFDGEVLGNLGKFYDEMNQILIEHNVLPSLASRQSHGVREVSSPNALGNSLGVSSAGQNLLPADESVESTVSPEVIEALNGLLNEPAQASASQPVTSEVSTLLKLLSFAQQKLFQQDALAKRAVRLDLRQIVSRMDEKRGAQTAIGRVDEEVINLVNMLFDFILEDKNLAAPMKALISRMQIPLVKVALVDKSFFTKGGHVARRLLNEMARAGLGWQGDTDAKGRDPLFRKMEEIVKTLVNDFDTDVEIFNDLLADFTAFQENEKRRIALMEKRTLDAEDGKAKAEVARSTVALEVELRIIDQSLPEVVYKIIDTVWTNVLFVNGLKHGYESAEWLESLSVLEDLVWSAKATEKPEVEDRQKLIKLVPQLLKRLRGGFDTISFNPFEMSSLFKGLEDVHLAKIRGLDFECYARVQSQTVARVSEPEKTVETVAKNAESAASVTSLESSEVADTDTTHIEPREPERNQQSEEPTLLEAADSGNADTSDQNITSKSAEAQVQETVPLANDDTYMQQVSRFVQGAWFDMLQGDSTIRCRLAAFIKPTSRYIFVNRNGMKVAEQTQQELAVALKLNQLTPLDNSMLFDRALETVVTSLRKNRS